LFVFACVRCDAELTAPLSQVCLPVHAHQKYGNGIQLPVLMEPGTFAVDPEPWGPPWRRWEELRPGEAEARGIYAPVRALSGGEPGAIVIAPGDARGTRLVPEKSGGACCGLDGRDGPNMACLACGLPVATRIDDCSLWQAVWLAPGSVRRVLVDEAGAAPLSWEELLDEGKGTPPFEPIAAWGAQGGSRCRWSWSPQWEAAAGRALAHLLAASGGQPLDVPGGLAADVFQRALDALLPVGPPEQRAALAGPRQPPEADAGTLLVPAHPQTGQAWAPAGLAASACLVPLPLGVWLWMASPQPQLVADRIPRDMGGDDPPLQCPDRPFTADPEAFRHALVRLPAVRSPWLRSILENLTHHTAAGLF
jgi:hypothetical protein